MNIQHPDLIKRILQHPDVEKQPNSQGEATAWCPWHDDKSGGNASLTINERKGIVKCFVCGNGGAMKLTKAWGIEVTRSDDLPPWKRPIERIHEYQDAQGKVLFQVLVHGYKLNGQKDVSQRQPDPGKPDGWAWNTKGVQLVPYNLPAILEAPKDTTVYIVEGEKDADNLKKAGLLATTNAMGAGKWRKYLNPIFKGHPVALFPDNDQPGIGHMQDVAANLSGVASSVKIIELPDLPDKGDVTDWLTKLSHDASELAPIIEAAPEFDPTDAEPPVDRDNYESKHRTPARQIIANMLAGGWFVDTPQSDEAYFFHQESKLLVPLDKDSRDLRILLNDQYGVNRQDPFFLYLREEMVNEARSRGKEAEIGKSSYYSPDNNIAYLDMSKGQMLRIDGDSITMRDNGTDGVLFKPDRTFQPWNYKPNVEEGAIIKTLINPLNFDQSIDVVAEPIEQQTMMLVWLLSLSFESIQPTKPIALAIGPTGSGKSNLFRRAGRLLFGSRFEVNGVKKDKEAEFWTLVTNKPFVCFDNADTQVPWLEDALATVSTGVEHSTRELFTTNDLATFVPKCFVGLTARTPRFRREDVASRLLIFRLDRLKEKRSERAILTEIDVARDGLMSNYVNMFSSILKTKPPLVDDIDPAIRLADFVGLATWMGAAFGDETHQVIVRALNNLTKTQHRYAIEENDLVTLLTEWVNRDAPRVHGEMVGMDPIANEDREITAGNLHKELKVISDDTGYPYWPKSPIALGKQITSLSEPLSLLFDVNLTPKKTGRFYTFKRRRDITVKG